MKQEIDELDNSILLYKQYLTPADAAPRNLSRGQSDENLGKWDEETRLLDFQRMLKIEMEVKNGLEKMRTYYQQQNQPFPSDALKQYEDAETKIAFIRNQIYRLQQQPHEQDKDSSHATSLSDANKAFSKLPGWQKCLE
jgi:hypothetical protein